MIAGCKPDSVPSNGPNIHALKCTKYIARVSIHVILVLNYVWIYINSTSTKKGDNHFHYKIPSSFFPNVRSKLLRLCKFESQFSSLHLGFEPNHIKKFKF